MKKTRIAILAAVVVMALVIAVVPTFAATFDQVQSFEVDSDGDGEPDYWDLRGDVHYYCHDSMMFDGYCGVIFNEAHYPSAAFVGQNYYGYYTNAQEGVPGMFEALVVARDLDENRAYMGVVFQCYDGSLPKVYGAVPGGTYKGYISIPGIIDFGDGIDSLESCELVNIRAGMLVMPGYGRILFDAVDMNIP